MARKIREFLKNLINFTNVKIISTWILLGLIFFQVYMRLIKKEASCKTLFSTGTSKPGDIGSWNTPGCEIHKYKISELGSCFSVPDVDGHRRVHIALIGDSRMQNFLEHFETIFDNVRHDKINRPEEDLVWQSKEHNIKISFFWQPILNEHTLEVVKSLTTRRDTPDLIIMGISLWHIEYQPDGQNTLEVYRKKLKFDLKPALEKLLRRKNSKVLWMLQPKILRPDYFNFIDNKSIKEFNDAAVNALKSVKTSSSDFFIWSSFREVVDHCPKPMQVDGLHFGKAELDVGVNMLFNFLCNKYHDVSPQTCCKDPETLSIQQDVIFALFTISVVSFVLGGLYRLCGARLPIPNRLLTPFDFSPEANTLVVAVTKLGFILAYIYVCNNTNLFTIETSPAFRYRDFLVPSGIFLAIGILCREASQNSQVLNRQQTEEWKGWMQVLILIYHFTRGFSNLPTYVLMRFLVSSYLFLNGFGHAMFAIKSEDKVESTSKVLVRLFTIVFRMNFFYFLLCLVTNNHYHHFYFVPLITFWFIVQYLFCFWPSQLFKSKISKSFFIIVSTFCIMATITFILQSEAIFETLFKFYPWEFPISSPKWTIEMWKGRLEVDKYSSCFGAIFGVIFSIFSNCGWTNVPKSFQIVSKFCGALCGLFGFGIFILISSTFSVRKKYLKFHPYIVLIPIVSFVILRNISDTFRKTYSIFFAWIGKFSLELYMAQFHIWMGNEGFGRLILIPNYPFLNLLVTTSTFVCLCHEMNLITGVIANFLTSFSSPKLMKNIQKTSPLNA